jgi:hypothetical protein
MQKTAHRKRHIIQENAYTGIVTARYLKRAVYLDSIMILSERTTERVAWEEFAARIVRKSAKNLNVQIVFDKIIAYVIYAKTLWPEVLTDYQYLRFL